MVPVSVTIFTDPGCPFGFNAQRQELQLQWHYGDALDVRRRMIVLVEQPVSLAERGMSPDMLRRNAERLREQYGMPMLVRDPPDLMPATLPGCRAYVGARRDEPARANALLRALRRLAFSEGRALDTPETLQAAADQAGIARDALDTWLVDDQVETELREDMAATRSPAPEALALAHRLSRSGDGLRYSTASAVFEHGPRRVVMAGFQPFAVYEVAMANVAPDVARRPAPDSVEQILDWAPYPLATAEVAELRGIGRDQAREELQRAEAELEPVAGDGYWSRA